MGEPAADTFGNALKDYLDRAQRNAAPATSSVDHLWIAISSASKRESRRDARSITASGLTIRNALRTSGASA
jgi:hypothetical protein